MDSGGFVNMISKHKSILTGVNNVAKQQLTQNQTEEAKGPHSAQEQTNSRPPLGDTPKSNQIFYLKKRNKKVLIHAIRKRVNLNLTV